MVSVRPLLSLFGSVNGLAGRMPERWHISWGLQQESSVQETLHSAPSQGFELSCLQSALGISSRVDTQEEEKDLMCNCLKDTLAVSAWAARAVG